MPALSEKERKRKIYHYHLFENFFQPSKKFDAAVLSRGFPANRLPNRVALGC